jgi:E3 ubiquitin-protein ligase TRIP12
LGPTLEFYALVSTELQRSDLALWNDGDSYKNQQIMADAIKSPAIPASDEQSQMIYIHQPSSASSLLSNDDSSGNNNNNTGDNLINNNEINMLIEQTLDQQNEANLNDSAHRNPNNIQFVNVPHGLFPMPLSKAAKTSQVSRLKFKFKFLGKFMAKAVMDSRMVNIL